jgi:transglutaminase-like putative cysteine protease
MDGTSGATVQLQIGFRLGFAIPAPTPMLLLLRTLPGRYVFPRPEQIVVSPAVPWEPFIDAYGNSSCRLVAPAGNFQVSSDGTVEVPDQPDQHAWQAVQHPVNELPIETLRYLVASRYCEIDRLGEFAWQRFGSGPTGYLRVQAVCDFVHQHITFGYQFARSTKSAYDAYVERQGVCRDFAHLAVTLCRSLGIPARYATKYLNNIGVPADPAPMDFSAWFEAYLSGSWHTFDARHNHPRIGRVVIAYGRDAADTALTTSFGPTVLNHFEVWTRPAL